MSRFPVQTAITIASIGCLLAAAPLVVPRLAKVRLSQLAALTDFTPERTPLSPLVAREPEPPIAFTERSGEARSGRPAPLRA